MTPDPSPSPTHLIIPTPGPATWDVIAQWLAIGLLTTGTVILVAFVAEKLVSSDKKREIKPFYLWIAAIAFFGGLLSFFLPIAINSGFNKDDDGSRLRQALLYTTGGLLGVITLGETHRKNDLEKEKNEQDHTRQVYAERRSRYTAAVEQLANEKAAVRLGGIYTLVGLVDEWLTDDTLNPKERQKEGQVIINNLCSYIRSPFPLAAKIEEYEAHKELEELQKSESGKLSKEGSLWLQILIKRFEILIKRFEDSDEYEKPKDITTDYAKFHEEQDVRRTIFVEMSKRSSTFTKNDKGEIIETVPGIWSDFDFDFSRAPIFYPLRSLTIEKGNFSSAKFYSNADFIGATFTQNAHFREATFTQNANFVLATFTQNADFSQATFTQNADFSQATFTQTADFSQATFTQNADFKWATFTQNAYFREATFTQNADFSLATFTQTANFSEVIFSTSSPKFVETVEVKYAEISKVLELTFGARFATLPKNQQAHNFAVHEDSQPILLGEAELNGVKHDIPVGTLLFDPSSGETSKRAKHREDSDAEEEKPTK